MIAKDFLLDDNGDLLFINGDLVCGPSDGQHIEDILDIDPGQLKDSPLVGVGLSGYINGIKDGKLRKEIKLQLQADGYNVDLINFDNDNINIDADRIS